MEVNWIRQVGVTEGEAPCQIRQLVELKRSLKAALTKRDWSLVCRIDRLSGQLVNKMVATDRDAMQELLHELLEIKGLYNQSLLMIEKELSDLSNQAF